MVEGVGRQDDRALDPALPLAAYTRTELASGSRVHVNVGRVRISQGADPFPQLFGKAASWGGAGRDASQFALCPGDDSAFTNPPLVAAQSAHGCRPRLPG